MSPPLIPLFYSPYLEAGICSFDIKSREIYYDALNIWQFYQEKKLNSSQKLPKGDGIIIIK